MPKTSLAIRANGFHGVNGPLDRRESLGAGDSPDTGRGINDLS